MTILMALVAAWLFVAPLGIPAGLLAMTARRLIGRQRERRLESAGDHRRFPGAG